MTINYPPELPPLRLGSTYELVNPQLNTDLQNGRTRSRRNFTATPMKFPAMFAYTDEQALVFEDFYHNTLGDGVAWFNMPIIKPAGLKIESVQIVGGYSRALIGAPHPTKATGRMFEYNMRMETYLRDASHLGRCYTSAHWETKEW
jgi:hypothetical protein